MRKLCINFERTGGQGGGRKNIVGGYVRNKQHGSQKERGFGNIIGKCVILVVICVLYEYTYTCMGAHIHMHVDVLTNSSSNLFRMNVKVKAIVKVRQPREETDRITLTIVIIRHVYQPPVSFSGLHRSSFGLNDIYVLPMGDSIFFFFFIFQVREQRVSIGE